MSATSSTSFAPSGPAPFLLRFEALFDPGRGYAFPCDARGQVDMDGLGRRAMTNYLFARSTIGREFHAPVVCPSGAAR